MSAASRNLNQERIDSLVLEHGNTLRRLIRNAVPGILDKHRLEARLLDLSMEDSQFRTNLLRFIDVFPVLKEPQEIADHLRDYLDSGTGISLFETILHGAIAVTGTSIGSKALSAVIEKFARHFIAGNDIAEALPVLTSLREEGFASTVDLLGEATLSRKEACIYQERYLELIDKLAEVSHTWSEDPILDRDSSGEFPRANVSVKISAMESRLDPLDLEGSVERLMPMVLPVFQRAKERRVFVNLDLETWELNEITYTLFERIALLDEFREWPHIGIVLQAYLIRSGELFDTLVRLANRRKTPFTVRLVKGAYRDFEATHSRLRTLPERVFASKEETDANYERLTIRLFENIRLLKPAFAGHNHRSILHAKAAAELLGIDRHDYEIQMLYGMAEPERKALREMGHRVRLYAPIGELLAGIGYLVRRLLENTSNQSFLRLNYREAVGYEKLLERPSSSELHSKRDDKGARGNGEKKREKSASASIAFVNAPESDFTDPRIRNGFLDAMNAARKRTMHPVPVVINGREAFSGETRVIRAPGDRTIEIAEIAQATRSDVEHAVQAAMEGWPDWRDTAIERRAETVSNLALLLRKNRSDLCALMALETGKPIREADGDVGEAIDFCRFYAMRAGEELGSRRIGTLPGEENHLLYQGRGPTAVIAPWNFPIAILCGMTAAALVSGNSVIMKPSGNSSLLGYELFRLFLDAGVPEGVIHFVPGPGASIGNALVSHPLIAQIAFTGGRDTGLSILETAAKFQAGQRELKRVVCEMGGKNGIIVDSDADLDEAVGGDPKRVRVCRSEVLRVLPRHHRRKQNPYSICGAIERGMR